LTTHAPLIGELQAQRPFRARLGPTGTLPYELVTTTDHRHNFTELPRIRSARPAFELHYPHMIERLRDEAHVRRARHGTHQDDAMAVAIASERRAP
jgi:hypothetical protein